MMLRSRTLAPGILLGVVSSALALWCAPAVAEDAPQPANRNELLIAAQAVCPVSGGKLDAHGAPLKATIGERTIFLCCRRCVGREIPKENWNKVLHNLAAAQGICPVMKKALPKQPASVVAEGRTVFVCCPPCGGKIQAEPEKYLAIVDAQLKKNVGGK